MTPEPENSDQDLYDQLASYTLELRDPEFIHQHIVDVYAVQHSGPGTKPIAIVFGLIGLYLYVEKEFHGPPGPARPPATRQAPQKVDRTTDPVRAARHH